MSRLTRSTRFDGAAPVSPARRSPTPPRRAAAARGAIALLAGLTVLTAAAGAARAQGLVYPKAAKVDHVDDYFGT